MIKYFPFDPAGEAPSAQIPAWPSRKEKSSFLNPAGTKTPLAAQMRCRKAATGFGARPR
jgi:hypothetical protein